MWRLIILMVGVSISFLGSAHGDEGSPTFVPDFQFEAGDGSILIEDGDSFWIGNHKVRLYGVDTVETKQVCEAGNRSVDCNKLTMDYAAPLFNDPTLVCKPLLGKFQKPWVQDGRYVSICFVNGEELNRKMILDGWALNYQRIGGNRYAEIELVAKKAKRGLHQFNFERPIKTRRQPNECAPASK